MRLKVVGVMAGQNTVRVMAGQKAVNVMTGQKVVRVMACQETDRDGWSGVCGGNGWLVIIL